MSAQLCTAHGTAHRLAEGKSRACVFLQSLLVERLETDGALDLVAWSFPWAGIFKEKNK